MVKDYEEQLGNLKKKLTQLENTKVEEVTKTI